MFLNLFNSIVFPKDYISIIIINYYYKFQEFSPELLRTNRMNKEIEFIYINKE